MLRTTSGLVANKLIFADSINEVSSNKLIIEDNSKEFKTRFLILGAKLTFAELRQAFSLSPILHYFDLKCHIWRETDVLDYIPGEILNQPSSDDLS